MNGNELPLVPIHKDSQRTIHERKSTVNSIRKSLLVALGLFMAMPGSCVAVGCVAAAVANKCSRPAQDTQQWYSSPENGDFHKRNEEITQAFMQEFPRMLAATKPDLRTVFHRRFSYRGSEFSVRYYFQPHEDSSLSIPYEVLGPENDFQYRFQGSIEIPASKTEL